jgi:Fe-S-cluster-containing hydrogenase component 2
MKNVRKIIKIDEELCDGCGLCVPDCAEGSLKIIDGKAKLVADNLCDGLGACLGACPQGALQIIEREADEFDEEAVEEYLAQEKKKAETPKTMDCGCASTHIQSFAPVSPCQSANTPQAIPPEGGAATGLSHWPVQIRLVPPTAPFLQNADLLIAADCSAVAARNFQEKYLDGKAVMMGCPKFDDAEMYVDRFAEILKNCNLQSITVLIMEVPCCSAMNVIVRRAIEKSGVSIPVEQVTLSVKGEEVERKPW